MSDPRLERLIDEAALRRTAELYAQGADRRDKALWASIMTEDCVIEAPGIELRGRAQIVGALDIMAQLYAATQHRVHNQIVSIEGDAAPLRQRFSRFPNIRLLSGTGPIVELECADIKKVLQHVVAALNEQRVELAGLETEEPNLERVFLHLTGRALRD